MSRVTLSILTTSPEHTGETGEALGALARAGDVFALDGPLGAGKTCLVRGFAAGLGIDPAQVSSPTFVVVTEHVARGGAVLAHADAYRLKGPEDLESVGWDRINDGSAVVVVEWAERLAGVGGEVSSGGVLGDEAFVGRVRLTPIGASTRRIDLDLPAAWSLRREWAAITMLAERQSPCPICGKSVAVVSTDRPFCSDRCRGADLDRWLTGQYAIPDHGDDADQPREDHEP